MADSFTPNLNLIKPEVGAAFDTWGGVTGLNHDMDLLDAVFLATGLGTSVGLHVGAGKVLNVEGQLQVADSTDTTKRATFSADLIPTATTINLALPPEGGTLATKEILVATVTAAHPVGTVLSGYYGPTPPSGYVFLFGTIGDATSLATNRANVDCERLFKHLWSVTAQAQCPVTTNTGAASTRGTTAHDDWIAHKRFALPQHAGRAMATRDNISGSAAGVISGGFGNTRAGVTGAEKSNVMDGPTTTTGSLQGGPDVMAASIGHTHANVYVIQPTIFVDVIIAL